MRSQETSQPTKYLLKTESLKVKAGIGLLNNLEKPRSGKACTIVKSMERLLRF